MQGPLKFPGAASISMLKHHGGGRDRPSVSEPPSKSHLRCYATESLPKSCEYVPYASGSHVSVAESFSMELAIRCRSQVATWMGGFFGASKDRVLRPWVAVAQNPQTGCQMSGFVKHQFYSLRLSYSNQPKNTRLASRKSPVARELNLGGT